MIRRLATAILLCFAAAWLPLNGAAARVYRPAGASADTQVERSFAARRLGRIVDLVERSNAPELVGPVHWRRLLAQHRPAIEQARTHAAFAGAVNRLLKATGISHFQYFTDEDWAYWLLLSFFFEGEPGVEVEHVGLQTQCIQGRWFVRGVLEGSAAAETMIRVGDEVLSVDGRPFQPVDSFRGKADRPVRIRLRRKPGLMYNVSAIPRTESLYRALRQAIRRSIKVIDHDGLRMAYIHGWCLLGSGPEYARLLEMQARVDGLLLDYRDGVGGLPEIAIQFLLGEDRQQSRWRNSGHWAKPVVILTADGTRSGKELVVHAVQTAGRAPLLGEPTPGAVTGATALRLGHNGLLLLPVQRHALEGKPTLPDIPLARLIPYCAGADPQLAAAKRVLAKIIRNLHLVPKGPSLTSVAPQIQ